MSQFTLVRHSAYAVGGNADFEDAVEACELTGQQQYHVRSAGGLLFPSLTEAQAAAQLANFPPGAAGPRPQAGGYFSSLRVAGAEIYVPRAGP
jgi:hypothetical protein